MHIVVLCTVKLLSYLHDKYIPIMERDTGRKRHLMVGFPCVCDCVRFSVRVYPLYSRVNPRIYI